MGDGSDTENNAESSGGESDEDTSSEDTPSLYDYESYDEYYEDVIEPNINERRVENQTESKLLVWSIRAFKFLFPKLVILFVLASLVYVAILILPSIIEIIIESFTK